MHISQDTMDTRCYAGFFVRFGAYLTDCFLVEVILSVFKIPMNYVTFLAGETTLTRDIIFHYSLWDIILYLMGVLYFVLLTYFTGATVGKRIFRIHVVAERPGDKLRFFDIFYRETIGRFFCKASLFFGYILAGVDAEKRGLHDIVSDTRVVYTLKTVERVVIMKQIEKDMDPENDSQRNKQES